MTTQCNTPELETYNPTALADSERIRECIRTGDLGDLDRDEVWHALHNVVEGVEDDIARDDYDNTEDKVADENLSQRLWELLGEFEKKFGVSSGWRFGPQGYDPDAP